ncbi:hypothetical protein SELMODRAFT_270709 [Selaginella moellendorffii]|uniref:Protein DETOXIFICATION n=1 Tax=Selaginella moellendorffii TaxID=88036 RepID=D8RBC7_SELML|nr:protein DETOXIFICATION 16 isoform X2 [Selaginella moellendorffii]EFJ30475.1 hypothetical protein SELMODRAFT_270709 [Selaginella moellendorffii]|eukprot:XP_002968221.1 protein DETOXIFICATION 16 isoform X2 [Selaginella moellendorffii]
MGTKGDALASSKLKIEVGKQLWLAVPMIGVNLVQFSRTIVSVMFVGHLGELELSSASIASSFCVVTGYSLLMGLGSALETLCGQAYGAKQYHLLGVYMQRAMILLNIVCLPIAVMWYNMEHVLVFFKQDPDISMKAGIYARYMIPGLFALAFLQPLVKFLQSQSKVLPMFLCSAAASIVHALLCWLFIFKLGMGNTGAAVTVSFSYWLNAVLLVAVVVMTPSARECWHGFSAQAFEGFIEFLKLAIPSAVMVCFEWWSFEALVLLSGLLPNPQLDASVFSIILNTIATCYMIPSGIGAATSTRVANELGAGRAAPARFAFLVSMGLAVMDAVIISLIIVSLRNVLGKAYSNEAEVVAEVAEMVPLLAAVIVMDALQGVTSGVARGCGWQALAAFVNLGAYYAVGLPLGCTLAFHFGLLGKGFLIGLLCGVTLQAAFLLFISVLTNWTQMAEAAIKRVEAQEIIRLLE